jgi:hypothetical protein
MPRFSIFLSRVRRRWLRATLKCLNIGRISDAPVEKCACSIQGLKFAHRSGRFFLVIRHLKYKAQFYRVLKVNCLSRFYVDRLWVVIDEYIVMANNTISRQDGKPIISAIADPQVRSVIQIEFQIVDEGTDRRPWAIHNDGAKVRARFRSRHALSGGCDRQHGNDRQ